MVDLQKTFNRVKDAQSELVAAQTRLNDAQAEQQSLCTKLEETYGTSDVEELKGVLAGKETELKTKLEKIDKILADTPQA